MKSIKVLNISSGDQIGSRFNGFDWIDGLKERGVLSSIAVNWSRDSGLNSVFDLSGRNKSRYTRSIRRLVYLEFMRRGVEYADYYWSKSVFKNKHYKEADLVHLQIVHDGTLSLNVIERIMREKPTVWTWHDPWPLTGHCVYPMTCSRFELGCGNCPDLDRPFRVQIDRTKENRERKHELIQKIQNVHVSTHWFASLIKKSLLGINLNINVLPFGIDSRQFEIVNKQSIRRNFGIESENFVIGIRATSNPQKNFKLFLDTLELLPPDPNLVIVTIEATGLLQRYEKKFRIVELPWTNNHENLLQFYGLLDVFLMPSLYETFGFMGLEAQSCGVPVIGLPNTALDEILNLKENGYLIPSGKPEELLNLLRCLPNLQSDLESKSNLSRANAKDNFNQEVFLDNLVSLYLKTIKDFSNYVK